jgi:hypothetical protein
MRFEFRIPNSEVGDSSNLEVGDSSILEVGGSCNLGVGASGNHKVRFLLSESLDLPPRNSEF